MWILASCLLVTEESTILKHRLFSHASVRPASGVSAGLQPLPPGRPLSLASGASAGQALPHAASLQCPSLPALPAGRRTLCATWWVRQSRLCLTSIPRLLLLNLLNLLLNTFTLLFLAPSSGDRTKQPSSSQRVQWWRSGGGIPALPGEHCQRDLHPSARSQLAKLLAPHRQCVLHVMSFQFIYYMTLTSMWNTCQCSGGCWGQQPPGCYSWPN